jgi:hypothetical protein
MKKNTNRKKIKSDNLWQEKKIKGKKKREISLLKKTMYHFKNAFINIFFG